MYQLGQHCFCCLKFSHLTAFELHDDEHYEVDEDKK